MTIGFATRLFVITLVVSLAYVEGSFWQKQSVHLVALVA